MEAANRGAADVPGGRSIGMGISLPFESGLNPYVTPELAFEYHYFFTRKLCMAFHMQALVVAPGGFGTCDEMFEMMTLKQTGKMQSNLPIVLPGRAYWKRVINWNAFYEAGTIKLGRRRLSSSLTTSTRPSITSPSALRPPSGAPCQSAEQVVFPYGYFAFYCLRTCARVRHVMCQSV